MAADRTNEKVANYLIEAKEILLMLINEFTKKAHNKNKTVSICGELASDTSIIKELLKIDIDALSIAPSLIPEIKAFIRSLE